MESGRIPVLAPTHPTFGRLHQTCDIIILNQTISPSSKPNNEDASRRPNSSPNLSTINTEVLFIVILRAFRRSAALFMRYPHSGFTVIIIAAIGKLMLLC